MNTKASSGKEPLMLCKIQLSDIFSKLSGIISQDIAIAFMSECELSQPFASYQVSNLGEEQKDKLKKFKEMANIVKSEIIIQEGDEIYNKYMDSCNGTPPPLGLALSFILQYCGLSEGDGSFMDKKITEKKEGLVESLLQEKTEGMKLFEKILTAKGTINKGDEDMQRLFAILREREEANIYLGEFSRLPAGSLVKILCRGEYDNYMERHELFTHKASRQNGEINPNEYELEKNFIEGIFEDEKYSFNGSLASILK